MVLSVTSWAVSCGGGQSHHRQLFWPWELALERAEVLTVFVSQS